MLRKKAMDMEGLFLVSGSSSEIETLSAAIEDGNISCIEKCTNMYTIAGVVERFFRDLPEPLLTFALFDEFLDTIELEDHRLRLQTIHELLHGLPIENRKLTHFMVAFFSDFLNNLDRLGLQSAIKSESDFEDCYSEGGSGSAIAETFGSLFLNFASDTASSTEKMLRVKDTPKVLDFMILHYDELFMFNSPCACSQAGFRPSIKLQQVVKSGSDSNTASKSPHNLTKQKQDNNGTFDQHLIDFL